MVAERSRQPVVVVETSIIMTSLSSLAAFLGNNSFQVEASAAEAAVREKYPLLLVRKNAFWVCRIIGLRFSFCCPSIKPLSYTMFVSVSVFVWSIAYNRKKMKRS